MKVTRTSPIDGKEYTMDLDIAHSQEEAYYSGELIQNAFPNLSPPEREFWKSGITPVQWKELFC